MHSPALRVVWALLATVVTFVFATLAVGAWWSNRGLVGKRGDTIDNIAVKPRLSQSSPVAGGLLQRKLAMQPEANRFRRRLGQRFLRPGREISVLSGTLSVGVKNYLVRIMRRQDDDDERLTISLNGGESAFTWTGRDGVRTNESTLAEDWRIVIERLALDSADQFILAQLRGASYQTVAQQARPAEAGGVSEYKGPIWDVVRIGEPPQPGHNLPLSRWRLYHINAGTGLIDKIVSEEKGQTITAEISGWANQNGETLPSRIIWKQDGQVVMGLSLNNITHGPKQ